MANVVIIGATGGVGQRLARLLVGSGHTVIGLHRKPEQATAMSGNGVSPVLGDIIEMTPSELADAAQGADVIVFTAGAAGSGLDRTTAIDGDGPGRAIEAARILGITRFYLVSAFPEAGRLRERVDAFEHYMAQKKRADAHVAASDLDWVILRPGKLLDGPGGDTVSLGRAITYGDVDRETVARVLLALIEQPLVRREILELTDGRTPIQEAIGDLRQG